MTQITAALAIVGTALSASASVTPFTETFSNDPSDWTSSNRGALSWFSTGALDGSSYVSGSADLNTAGPFGLTLLRGEADDMASGGAFVGNYLTSGITTIEFDIRHNAGIDLDIAIRLASPTNMQGIAVQTGYLVASGEWTHVSFDLSFGNPLLSLEGPPSLAFYEQSMSSIGNLQVSTIRPDGLQTPLVADFDLDNVQITPTPGSAALLGLGMLGATRRRRS